MIKLVTFTTRGAARLAANWLESVRRLKLDHLAVICCGDVASFEAITRFAELTGASPAVRTICSHNATDKPIDWGTPAFPAQISLSKLALEQHLNDPDGFEPYLFCDADTVLLNDPTGVLDGPFTHAIFLQSDRNDDGQASTESNLVNVGVHYCGRPVPAVFAAASAWLTERLGAITDQAAGNYVDDQAAVCRALESTGVDWALLEPRRWRNGSQSWPSPNEHHDVLLVHANWVKGIANKEDRLKHTGYWFVNEDHLDDAGIGTRFELVVAHYQDADERRACEYEECLQLNLENSYIRHINLFMEDDSTVIEHPKLWCFPLNRRARYADLFGRANQLPGRRCIIANADVWFDDSLRELAYYDLRGKMLCVSRQDSIENYCQDAWICQPPLPHIEADFQFGQCSCDNRIAYEAHRAGLELLNPAGTIRVHHRHASGVRHWRANDALPGERLFVEPMTLDGQLLARQTFRYPIAFGRQRGFQALQTFRTARQDDPAPMGFKPGVHIFNQCLPVVNRGKK